MAYEQSQYQPPQRPYNGPAAQRPRPPPQQQYPPQGGYDQYPQDGYDNYDNGYAQNYAGDAGYQDVNGGARGNGYPEQQNNYPPQQQYYGDPRGRGRSPPQQGRGGMNRPPPQDAQRGGFDQRGRGQGRGGGPNGGPPPGRGGRPPMLDRTASSDPNARQMRQPPLNSPPKSPAGRPSYDNPFPSFSGSNQQNSRDDQSLTQKMGNMDMGPAQNGRPKTSGDRGNRDPYARGPPTDGGRPSMDTQRPRNYPPQGMPPGQGRGQPQGYPDQRRGPPGQGPPGQGYGGPQQNGFDNRSQNGSDPISPLREDFAPPGRSMTMPSQPPSGRQPPAQVNPIASERPYNGPIGRGMPPRPATATGGRPPPQRQYPPEAPAHSQKYSSIDPYLDTPSNNFDSPGMRESVSVIYDSYYYPPGEDPNQRPYSNGADDSNRGSFEQSGGQQAKQVRSQSTQPLPQPQAAVFEMVGDAPTMPDGSANERYGQPGQRQNGFQPPPRSTSAAPRMGGPQNGLPNGPSPQGGMPGHPAPVRPGHQANTSGHSANNKPPPVRNYNGVGPGAPNPAASPQNGPPAPLSPDEPPPVTPAELDQLRSACLSNPNDQATQLTFARKLVEASETLVLNIPDPKQRNKAKEKYSMEANRLVKKLVALQNPEAMFFMADCYGRGQLGLEQDHKEAFLLYQSAAKIGHAAAAYRTAVCCELGSDEGGGTRKDPMKAVQWYKRGATLGDTPAMYKMGMILLKGLLGQPRDPREAVGWLKRAAELADFENPHALHELGLLYAQPQGPDGAIQKDEAQAFQLFQQAADLGYRFSQFRLGSAYEYGLFNCTIDPRQSIMWYSRAAVQEEHQSELALSGWYLTGSEGVLQQSDTEAYLWARKAAMAGNAKAEYAMGYFTEVGIGIQSDLEAAKRWYWRAAAQQFPKARERLEDLKRAGKNGTVRSRERFSRSKINKNNEGECAIM